LKPVFVDDWKGKTMNRFAARSLFAASLLTSAAAAWAAGFPAATGEFSQADLAQAAQAVRARTAPAVTTHGRTRAEVMADFEAARCRGDLPYDSETGRTEREVFPGRYPLPGCR